MPYYPPTWTPERTQLLRNLWSDTTKTGKDISLAIFGDKFHKNAVVGKARRLKLSHRTSPINRHIWDDERFIKMWSAPAVTITHIAHVFGCGVQTVRRHADELRLPIRGMRRSITVPAPRGCIKCPCGVYALPGLKRCYSCSERGSHA